MFSLFKFDPALVSVGSDYQSYIYNFGNNYCLTDMEGKKRTQIIPTATACMYFYLQITSNKSSSKLKISLILPPMYIIIIDSTPSWPKKKKILLLLAAVCSLPKRKFPQCIHQLMKIISSQRSCFQTWNWKSNFLHFISRLVSKLWRTCVNVCTCSSLDRFGET